MLNKEQLQHYKKVLGFDLWQTERDYLQHLLLLFLSKNLKNDIIFKGGTALQKTYGLNRFSIDIDFTLKNPELNINELFKKIVIEFNNFGFKADFKEEKKKMSHTIIFIIQGPLYDGTEKTLSSLRVEISLREKIILKTETKEIIALYPDIQPYLINVMNLEEIFAEKIRAILSRAKARDVYDLWFLINKNIKFNEKTVDEKLKYYRMKFDQRKFLDSVKKVENIWMKELKPLLTFVPDFQDVYEKIKNYIK